MLLLMITFIYKIYSCPASCKWRPIQ